MAHGDVEPTRSNRAAVAHHLTERSRIGRGTAGPASMGSTARPRRASRPDQARRPRNAWTFTRPAALETPRAAADRQPASSACVGPTDRRRLGRSPSTISGELRRISSAHDVSGYDGDLAHSRARERPRVAASRPRCTRGPCFRWKPSAAPGLLRWARPSASPMRRAASRCSSSTAWTYRRSVAISVHPMMDITVRRSTP